MQNPDRALCIHGMDVVTIAQSLATSTTVLHKPAPAHQEQNCTESSSSTVDTAQDQQRGLDTRNAQGSQSHSYRGTELKATKALNAEL